VIDAPCSGSGLFRRDPEAISEWSEQNVQLCSARQQRIVHDAWPALKNGGLLVYSTCSYSQEEDENIVDGILNTFQAEYVPLLIQKEWEVVDTGKGYRFWPDKVKGEGFFLAVIRKNEGEERSDMKTKNELDLLSKKENNILEQWINIDKKSFIRQQQSIYAIPSDRIDAINYLQKQLRVLYSGVRVGELIRDKLIPDHALAMSKILSENIRRQELDYENAIRYLQRKEISLEAEKGWQLVSYKTHPLGWVNVLPNRVNNYYPKEFRIIKDKQ